MLVDSPRLNDRDRAEWARRERYDRRYAASPKISSLADQAMTDIREWAHRRAGLGDRHVTINVSWGKDSVTVADLALQALPADRVQIAWVRQRWYENPDCTSVRDVFAQKYPTVNITEKIVTSPVPRRWDDIDKTYYPPRPRKNGVWSSARITGIRADESDVREISAAVHGISTETSCRPILRWSADHVFAYLHRQRLPVHPAYAMTTKTIQGRDTIRVHSLGGLPGLTKGRVEWEDTYYGEDILRDRVAIACLRVLPAHKKDRRLLGDVTARVQSLVHEATARDVGSAMLWLSEQRMVARWESGRGEGWWRWDLPVAIPGTHMVGDMSGHPARRWPSADSSTENLGMSLFDTPN